MIFVFLSSMHDAYEASYVWKTYFGDLRLLISQITSLMFLVFCKILISTPKRRRCMQKFSFVWDYSDPSEHCISNLTELIIFLSDTSLPFLLADTSVNNRHNNSVTILIWTIISQQFSVIMTDQWFSVRTSHFSLNQCFHKHFWQNIFQLRHKSKQGCKPQ